MHFVMGLPKAKTGHDAISVIMDRLIKTAHFLPIHANYFMDQYIQLYI